MASGALPSATTNLLIRARRSSRRAYSLARAVFRSRFPLAWKPHSSGDFDASHFFDAASDDARQYRRHPGAHRVVCHATVRPRRFKSVRNRTSSSCAQSFHRGRAMRVPFSPRGARRGLLLAAIGAALWLSWAAGYLYASRPLAPQVSPSVTGPEKPNIETSGRTEA